MTRLNLNHFSEIVFKCDASRVCVGPTVLVSGSIHGYLNVWDIGTGAKLSTLGALEFRRNFKKSGKSAKGSDLDFSEAVKGLRLLGDFIICHKASGTS